MQIKTKTKHYQSINACFHEVNQTCKNGSKKVRRRRRLEEEEEEEEEERKKKNKNKKKE
jgi:hypothetical protein